MTMVSAWERRLLWFVCVVIVLHLIADAFLAPEPGTRWVDHVLPAAAAMVTLGIAAGIVLWGRAGPVGATALVLGIWSLVAAGLAATNVGDGRFRLDDATGLLLAAGGVLLVLTGSRLLWRTRHRDGRWVTRRLALSVVAVLVGAYLVLPVAIAIVATHRPRGVIEPVALGRPAHDLTLRTSDGLALRASYVPSRNGAAVVLFPDRAATAEHARLLVRHGYGILSVDMRGYGASEGDPNAFGWGATRDVDAAVSYLAARPDVKRGRVGGLGLSVGGELLLEAAASNTALRAVISDGAGERSVRESLTRGNSAALVLPLQAVQTAAVTVLGGDPPPAGLQDIVGRIAPRPILLVLSGRGGGGEDLNRTYAARGGSGTELWEIPEAEHTEGIRARPAAYERRVISFLNRALRIRPRDDSVSPSASPLQGSNPE